MSDFRRWALAAAIALAACGDDEGGQGVVDEGEAPVPGCADATTSSGALTRVCFPAEWNGDLILYAHGYVQPDGPLAIPDDLIGGTPVEDLINAAGYAYATTSYRANGLIADLAVDDLVQLKELVRRTVRPDPVRIYIVGVSEGGLVAALAAEAPLDPYTGVLAACAPIGDFARQIDYFNDVRVVFDYFFPGVIPGSPIDPPEEVRAGWDATYAPAVVAALTDDPAAALELAEVTGIPAEGLDPGALGEAVAGILWYNVLGTANAAAAWRPAVRQRRKELPGLLRRRGAERGGRSVHRGRQCPRGADSLRDHGPAHGADLDHSHHRRSGRAVLSPGALRRQGGGQRPERAPRAQRRGALRALRPHVERDPRCLRRTLPISAASPCDSA
jgi:hypothetical protein